MTSLRRGVAALVALFAMAATLVAVPAAHAQTTARAVVIVSTGAGVQRSVIEFSGTISGLEALQRAGASPETITYGPMGQAVCKLYGVGDPPVPGSCPGGWVYYRAVGGAGGWTQSGLGASSTAVHDGDVEGWGYGGAPPFSSFCAIAGCAPPPTSPPASPPASAPGSPSPSPSPASAGGPVGVAGITATTAPAGTAPGTTDATSPGTDNTHGATTTTVAGGTRASSGTKHLDRTLAAGAGTATSSGSGGGGSPVGVIVALVVVVLLVGGGVALRRRRAGT